MSVPTLDRMPSGHGYFEPNPRGLGLSSWPSILFGQGRFGRTLGVSCLIGQKKYRSYHTFLLAFRSWMTSILVRPPSSVATLLQLCQIDMDNFISDQMKNTCVTKKSHKYSRKQNNAPAIVHLETWMGVQGGGRPIHGREAGFDGNRRGCQGPTPLSKPSRGYPPSPGAFAGE